MSTPSPSHLPRRLPRSLRAGHLPLWLLGVLISIGTLPHGDRLRAEPIQVVPSERLTLDEAQVKALTKSRGMKKLPPEMEAAMLNLKQKAVFNRLMTELRKTAYLLEREHYSGSLKESLAFAKSKGCELEDLKYAHYRFEDGDAPFTGEAVPFISIAIGTHKITILQDGSSREPAE